MKKTIGIVTGTRAEYGLLARTIAKLQQSNSVDTRIFVCGTHLSPEYGMTIEELRQNGVENIVPVEMLLSSNSRVGVAKSIGLATMGFADAFSREPLDCILVLGDRYEILAAAQTALILDIPLAHIHGGEVTEGAFDEAIRHSISKMANIHFPATREFALRIQQLGESPESTFVCGAPGVDNVINEPRMDKSSLEESLGFTLSSPLALVTYHPVTNTVNRDENDIGPLVKAIGARSDITFVVTYPNADGGGKSIIDQWQGVSSLDNVHIVPSLGFKRYLSLMEHVDCVIGNSSSGIIEAPSFKVGTINIGTRQKGRPRAASIIDLDMDYEQIIEAIDRCCSSSFKNSLVKTVNPYGEGNASSKIADVLIKTDLSSFKLKSFRDIHLGKQ